MEKNSYFDTSAVAGISVEKLNRIYKNIDDLICLVEKKNLTTSSREKEIFLYTIEEKILSMKDILDI